MYTGELSMPLLNLSPRDLLAAVRSSLAEDERVLSVTPQPQPREELEPAEHALRFSRRRLSLLAPSASARPPPFRSPSSL
jgi:hypothetical protein